MDTTQGPTTPAGLLCSCCGAGVRLIDISVNAATVQCTACQHRCTTPTTVELLRHADIVRAAAEAAAVAEVRS